MVIITNKFRDKCEGKQLCPECGNQLMDIHGVTNLRFICSSCGFKGTGIEATGGMVYSGPFEERGKQFTGTFTLEEEKKEW